MLELTDSRQELVGAIQVRRSLPSARRRTVGAWCFADHMGPAAATEHHGLDVGPHPHMGLQTVTWLLEGEALHRDSLGTEQLLRPGQLNLMTAGHGVAHSEEATGSYRGPLEGLQLWIAQPEATRHGTAAFEHHAELPQLELGEAVATVLIGELGAMASPARHDTGLLGVDLELRGPTALALEMRFEHALLVLRGSVEVDDDVVIPGQLAYLGADRDELRLKGTARALLLGGEPFEARPTMWWNSVARSRDEIEAAHASWLADDGRFGVVASALERIAVKGPPWRYEPDVEGRL